MVLCIGIRRGRRKKVMSTATAQACQTWPLASCSSPSACACLLDDSAGSGSASKQAWLSLAKVMSRSIRSAVGQCCSVSVRKTGRVQRKRARGAEKPRSAPSSLCALAVITPRGDARKTTTEESRARGGGGAGQAERDSRSRGGGRRSLVGRWATNSQWRREALVDTRQPAPTHSPPAHDQSTHCVFD